MQRALEAVEQSRRYAALAWETLQAVAAEMGERQHPLLARRERRRVVVVLFTSSRSLAGGFNAKICEATRRAGIHDMKAVAPDLVVDTVSVGRKGEIRKAQVSIGGRF